MTNRTTSPNRRGGVKRGHSWTREAAVAFEGFVGWPYCGKGGGSHCAACRHALDHALTVIFRHSRNPQTRAEASRLLGVLEGRG